MLIPPLVLIGGQIQQAVADDVVNPQRFALSPPSLIAVTGDFTMTASVHEAVATSNTNVKNIYGANAGELLLLIGDKVKLRKSGGNLAGMANNFTLKPKRSILLYFTGTLWMTVSELQ